MNGVSKIVISFDQRKNKITSTNNDYTLEKNDKNCTGWEKAVTLRTIYILELSMDEFQRE